MRDKIMLAYEDWDGIDLKEFADDIVAMLPTPGEAGLSEADGKKLWVACGYLRAAATTALELLRHTDEFSPVIIDNIAEDIDMSDLIIGKIIGLEPTQS